MGLWGAGQTDVNSQKQKVDTKAATVVYVSGNDLVVKTKEGEIRHFVVPGDFRFNIDGKEVETKDLKPGTELTQSITTTTKDTTVTKVRNVDAVVRMVNAPYLSVTLADGTPKRVKVPDGTKFTVDGEQKTVFDLREGMHLTGTIVTKTPETVVSTARKVTGKSPTPVDTPQFVGVLLIEEDLVAVSR
jgi:hypothetical protein